MKPREELEKEISITIRESFHKGFDSESVSELDNFDGFAEAEEALSHYAIGKWVSVEERLPEFDEFDVWEGYARLNNEIKSVEAGQWDELLLEHTTHWLELDLPEVGE